jgi:hypothetical protein
MQDNRCRLTAAYDHTDAHNGNLPLPTNDHNLKGAAISQLLATKLDVIFSFLLIHAVT